jgi:putative oxidoreductase
MTMQGTENTAALLGRVAMSILFIHGGWGKLLAPAATQAMLASHHLPMVKYGWVLAVVVELGGGSAILFGLFTRPVGLLLAIWCIANRPDRAYEFRRPQSGDPFLKKHGDDGRIFLCRGVRRRCLESRRTMVAPWSVAPSSPQVHRFFCLRPSPPSGGSPETGNPRDRSGPRAVRRQACSAAVTAWCAAGGA